MDSEDGVQYANDVVSLDDCDNGESDDTGWASDDGDRDDEFDNDTEDSISHCRLENYTILNEEDIRKRLEEDITEISTVLSIPKVSASILLRHYNWSIGRLHDAWFANEAKVREAVGLLERPVGQVHDVKELTCGICFDAYPRDRMLDAACGHPFCSSCWTSYVSTSINDGSGCLMLRCPDPSCGAAVNEDMIDLLVSDEDKRKYSRYLFMSYIEENKKIKWCPAPGCDYAVDFVVGSASYDVSCTCKYRFCWNCTKDAHRPVDCSTVEKWIIKNTAESENTNWILAYTKPCPQCKKPIEKNQGCSHMTCRPPCGFEFCWLCLDAWSKHDYNPCNVFGSTRHLKGGYDETEKIREMAQKSIERYTHYYERWAFNQSSIEKAIANLHQMKTDIDKLRDIQEQNEVEVNFITEAWLQIIECRRVLKWTYAYAYYLPEDEHAKRRLFEHLQGQAESELEKLHSCAEKEMQLHLNVKGPSEGFSCFRTKLVDRTTITRNYFENLARALENGLSDVESQGACSKTASSKSLGGSSNSERTGRGSKVSTSQTTFDDTPWICESCTFVNIGATICQFCGRGWSCEYCTFAFNPRGDTICQMCQQ